METIGMQVPATLYVALYERYREETSTVINKWLIQLLVPETSEEQKAEPGAQQVGRPRHGTITGRIWDIADRLHNETGSVTREAVIKECMLEGININTASTQFSYWRKAMS